MPAPHPKEFRDDVVAVARRGDALLSQVANDFGISQSCLRKWLRSADVEDGTRPGVTRQDSDELRELRRRNRRSTAEFPLRCRRAGRRIASRTGSTVGRGGSRVLMEANPSGITPLL